MKPSRGKRPKLSLLHEEIPEHLRELLRLTRLAEMGRLAGGVAHELNTPLMVVQGFAENLELLLDKVDPPRDEMRLQILEILKACQRMSRVINKMNRMSQGQKLRLHVVDAAEVVLNALDFMRAQFDALDVKLEFAFERPLPVHCDVVQVEQMVLNILSNALAAMEKNSGERRLRISFAQGGGWSQVKIHNNGPAIPAAVRAGLIDENSGLALSKAIMHVHGGDLRFTSDEVRGTEFILSFPQAKQNPWTARAHGRGGRILIIDRQPGYRLTLEEKFRLLGFQPESRADFASGLAALTNKRDEPPRAVLMDAVPGLSESLERIQRLRARLGPRTPIFVLSNFPSARDFKGEMKAAGANGFFEKPIHAAGFSLILRQLNAIPPAAADKVAA
jgi:hypothetical protein